MKVRSRGHTVAIVLGCLAVVIAGTGTAVAVTATVVNIADPSHPAQVARVDSSGRLKTNLPTSSIDLVYTVSVGQVVPLTDPTKATLAVSRLTFYNPEGNSAYLHTDLGASLLRILIGSSGTCTDPDITVSGILGFVHANPGQTAVDTYPAPVTVGPSGSAPYCIGVEVGSDDGTNPTSYNVPLVQLTGYVATGTYSGISRAAVPRTGLGSARRLTTPPHRVGVAMPPDHT